MEDFNGTCVGTKLSINHGYMKIQGYIYIFFLPKVKNCSEFLSVVQRNTELRSYRSAHVMKLDFSACFSTVSTGVLLLVLEERTSFW